MNTIQTQKELSEQAQKNGYKPVSNDEYDRFTVWMHNGT